MEGSSKHAGWGVRVVKKALGRIKAKLFIGAERIDNPGRSDILNPFFLVIGVDIYLPELCE